MTERPVQAKPGYWLLLAVLVIAVVVMAAVLLTRRQTPAAEPGVAAISETEYTGTVYDPPQPLSDFTLPASTGQPISLSDLKGRWLLVFFGYTHCPDFCPTTLAEFKRVKAALDDQAADVQFVFISVDGQRDSAEVLKDYLARFDPAFIGLSGDDNTLARIGPDYGLFYQRQTNTGSQADYLVDHSTRAYLIDPDGLLRVTYAYDTDAEIIAGSIRQQMAQPRS